MRRVGAGGAAEHASATVVVFTTRDRARSAARVAFPRRRTHLVLVRTLRDFIAVFHAQLVDVALVDLGSPNDDITRAIELAREYPSTPFVGLSPLRATDAALVARCAASDFADIVVESIDEPALRELVLPLAFTARFAAALREPPPQLHLTTALHRQAWHALVAHGGRPVLTETLAATMGITREHLSRAFASGAEAPNIKRVIDLVRLLAAAELAKNPGYDVSDVARVLGFASSSHLSTTAQRIVGTRPTSLARLRAIDLFERFGQGRSRSRRVTRPRAPS